MSQISSRQIVHVIGSGHSGSTLLDMILGGHTLISSLGEAHRLYFSLRNSGMDHRCTCGEEVNSCPFWVRVEKQAQASLDTVERPALRALTVGDPRLQILFGDKLSAEGPPRYLTSEESRIYRNRLNEAVLIVGSRIVARTMGRLSPVVVLHQRIATDTLKLYELVRRAHRTPVIVDSTKNPGTFKKIYMNADAPMRLIFLLRDGRAVCYSRMRRENVDMNTAARIWRAEHIKRAAAQLTIPPRRILKVNYEDLASRPEASVRAICDFLRLSFEPDMIRFREMRHNLGGNLMRFRRDDKEIRLDQTWRRELKKHDLHTFDRIAGKLNRKLGYA